MSHFRLIMGILLPLLMGCVKAPPLGAPVPHFEFVLPPLTPDENGVSLRCALRIDGPASLVAEMTLTNGGSRAIATLDDEFAWPFLRKSSTPLAWTLWRGDPVATQIPELSERYLRILPPGSTTVVFSRLELESRSGIPTTVHDRKAASQSLPMACGTAYWIWEGVALSTAIEELRVWSDAILFRGVIQ